MDYEHPIRTYRKAKGIPIGKLAAQLGVNRTAIYRWEKRERSIDRKLWAEISRKTGIPVAELAGATSDNSQAAE